MSIQLDSTTATLIAEHTGADSCGITLMGRPVSGSNRMAADLEDWQFVVAEGPAVASYRSARSVEYGDCESIVALGGRIAEYLIAAGIMAVAAFPLMVGTRCLGTITLYSMTPWPRDDQRRCAEGWAQQLADSIAADPHTWTEHRLVAAPDFDIATGRVMVSSSVDATTAAVLIRARAFAESVSLHALCQRIVHEDFTLGAYEG